MLFNSIQFVVFFTVVYLLYLLLQKKLTLQNILLLIAGYVFYGTWDWRFLFLIFTSTFIDYFVAINIHKSSNEKIRKLYLVLSIVVNLGILAFFKYFNFFISSFVELLALFQLEAHITTLEIVLPVGISFYTFQTMGYTIDVYRKDIKPTTNLIDFALYVNFFPQLVAGPIERASSLMGQIENKRILSTEKIYAGIFLIIWGFFKKVVIADNAALVANGVFGNYTSYQGFDLLVGVFAFTIQIYGDFSGYTDIARGIAMLLGFELMLNFRLPYFATSPSDFWQRWHISLSTWLRDYLYIPLGGNRKGKYRTLLNLFLTMLLGGLWHGAAWNFVFWGAFHGSILIIYRVISQWNEKRKQPIRINYFISILIMFNITLLGWFFFRVNSIDQIIYFSSNIVVPDFLQHLVSLRVLILITIPLLIIQLIQHRSNDLLFMTKLPTPILCIVYVLMLVGIFIFNTNQSIEFIYFQF